MTRNEVRIRTCSDNSSPGNSRKNDSLKRGLDISLFLKVFEKHPSPSLVLVGGLPGSGKSTLAAVLADSFPCASFSMDAKLARLRKRVEAAVASGERETDSRGLPWLSRAEWEEAREAVLFGVANALSSGTSAVVDETFTSSCRREEFLETAEKYGAPVIIVLLATPFETCVERDSKRVFPVGEENISRCAIFFKTPDGEYENFAEVMYAEASSREGYGEVSADVFEASLGERRRRHMEFRRRASESISLEQTI